MVIKIGCVESLKSCCWLIKMDWSNRLDWLLDLFWVSRNHIWLSRWLTWKVVTMELWSEVVNWFCDNKLQDRYVVVDTGAMLLGHALSYPNDVAVLLFLELEEGVEDAESKLSHESVHVHLDFLLEESVLNRLVTRVGTHILKEWSVILFKKEKWLLSNRLAW